MESSSKPLPHSSTTSTSSTTGRQSGVRLGLFTRTFALLAVLMLASLILWLQVFLNVEEGPRATQMAQRVASSVGISRSALIYAPSNTRTSLLLDLATKESLRVRARSTLDTLEPLPRTRYWKRVSEEIHERLGNHTLMAWSVNQEAGIWVSFDINQDKYWMVFDREQFVFRPGVEWFGWGLSALLLALIGAAISVGFVNRPLAQLVEVARQLSHGETPSRLPENGPVQIRNMNIAFNRMVRDIRQAETDREIMLAGISHDLRTPLARMRLEIEMSNVSEETRQAIDIDLAQVEYIISQLMEYSRPAQDIPAEGCNVSAALMELVEREQKLTQAQGGSLSTRIQPHLFARINWHDIKRIVANLFENARRYGKTPGNNGTQIHLVVREKADLIIIEVSDQGPGIPAIDTERVLRPFSRGEQARTGVNGAGLGLAIVVRLLAQVDGRLELLPNTPQGLIARIELPRLRSRTDYTLLAAY